MCINVLSLLALAVILITVTEYLRILNRNKSIYFGTLSRGTDDHEQKCTVTQECSAGNNGIWGTRKDGESRTVSKGQVITSKSHP